jgi:hypothetical protein
VVSSHIVNHTQFNDSDDSDIEEGSRSAKKFDKSKANNESAGGGVVSSNPDAVKVIVSPRGTTGNPRGTAGHTNAADPTTAVQRKNSLQPTTTTSQSGAAGGASYAFPSAGNNPPSTQPQQQQQQQQLKPTFNRIQSRRSSGISSGSTTMSTTAAIPIKTFTLDF